MPGALDKKCDVVEDWKTFLSMLIRWSDIKIGIFDGL